MKITKYHIIVALLVIAVIFIAAILGIWLGNGGTWYRTIAEGIIIPNDDEEHESVLLESYVEYTELLSNLGIARDVFLTSGNFDDHDYIVDYIYYEDDLKINEINLNITDEGTIIQYEVNKEIEDSPEILIYFIPIEKDSLNYYVFASREFEVK